MNRADVITWFVKMRSWDLANNQIDGSVVDEAHILLLTSYVILCGLFSHCSDDLPDQPLAEKQENV